MKLLFNIIVLIIFCYPCFSLTFPIPLEHCLYRGNRILLTGWYYEDRGAYKHRALDIPASIGTPVKSVTSGNVIIKDFQYNRGKRQTFGNYLGIQDKEGFIWIYGHLHNYNVNIGDKVKEGQIIGSVGWTGLDYCAPHLHIEKRDNKGNKILFTKDFNLRFSLRRR